MKIVVAGRDRSSELPSRWESGRRRTAECRASGFAPQDSALALRNARSTAEYQDILMNLIRVRRQISVSYFPPSAGRGIVRRLAAKLQSVLWRVLRYQQFRLVFQQNAFNESVISALEFEREERRRATAELLRRVESLEQKRDGGK